MLDKRIQVAGSYQQGDRRKIPDSLFTFTDFSWLNRSPTLEQQQNFRNMKYPPRPEDQRYVSTKSPYGKVGRGLFNADSA